MFDKKFVIEAYNKEEFKPIIKANMSTSEKIAGFIDLQTGNFVEIMSIRNSADMDFFLDKYEISVAEIKTEM